MSMSKIQSPSQSPAPLVTEHALEQSHVAPPPVQAVASNSIDQNRTAPLMTCTSSAGPSTSRAAGAGPTSDVVEAPMPRRARLPYAGPVFRHEDDT